MTTLINGFKIMYNDLLMNKLQVVLVPSTNENRANNGCCSRVVVEQNPKWYQEFCSRYLDKRKKSIISRKRIIKTLERLSKGKITHSKYYPHLKGIADKINEELELTDFELECFYETGKLPEKFDNQF